MNIFTRSWASGAGWPVRLLFAASLGLVAAADGVEPLPANPVIVRSGVTRAIHYRDLSGTTTIGFRGTVLLPEARGTAKLRLGPGATAIKARFEHLAPASRFGQGFLTYVLWAVTPAGRPVNLGEVVPGPTGRARVEARTHLQTFGLVVTAEPHFAVTQVGSLVVLENVLTGATRGRLEEVQVRYDWAPREAYTLEGNPADLQPMPLDRRIHPVVYQAFNAVRLAQREQADQYAPAEYRRAVGLLNQLETEKKKWKKPAILLARQTVQQAEDARLMAIRSRDQARLEAERRDAEEARRAADEARAESEAAKADAEATRLSAQMEAEQAKAQASTEAQRAREMATREVNATQRALRERLRDQLSRLLDTRETDQGLRVRLPDLLFPSGQASLAPPVRVKLAKAAGILLAYPGVQVRVEGHADSTGRESFNRFLSARRAHAVRGFLLRQGLAPETVSAVGLGAQAPLADNATPAGRQQNRRVELALTGDPIGF